MSSIYCTIITIGDELLIGQTIDTNSAWIAQQLNALGIKIKNRIAVGDNKPDITAALDSAIELSNIVILTGGLGPTSDDITKPLLCDYFGGTLIVNEAVRQHVVAYFEKRKRPQLQSNINQALVPDVCDVLFNEMGTAPGMLFRKGDRTIISLPGVPMEMKHIMTTSVLSILAQRYDTPRYIHRTLLTAGKGESFVADMLQSFEAQLPEQIKIAYLPNLGSLKIRLTGENIEEEIVEQQFQLLRHEVASIEVAPKDTDLEHAVHELLLQLNKTISTAESCTGGLIASRLTSISGSSAYFIGGMVSYATEAKINVLGVNASTIEAHTVVSEEVVIEMAQQARLKFNTDIAIASSGYLEKGEKENEVWLGLASANATHAIQLHVPYDRQKNAVLVVNTALNAIRLFLKP